MHAFIPAVVSALALGVSATPSRHWWGFGKDFNGQCLSDDCANTVANNFKSLISDYSNGLADSVLTTDYVDYSDSVNELINNGCATGHAPLGTATFSSRSQFEAGQGGQPNIPFEILNVWHSCDTVTMRWRSSAPGGSNAQQVTGIAVQQVVRNYNGGQKWLIKETFSEFNSGAWLADLNITVPTNCNAVHKRATLM
ncbi:hypothetical protein LTR95_011119 [Oleoguttula sp. CCFEE 5521]|uniref:NTF2-like domain-containing protein n=1 Tax=Cryoendolithus antarcticus TaxID=1507870 RepID=A0A1V8T864_9PEZI|nr:hypothetical protein B0A48_07059 [Cryoendolithus antarcticus]OQO20351.1 hypothetical protein B0A51_12015 [Rachicladosporium sp. CCFEE 5018]